MSDILKAGKRRENGNEMVVARLSARLCKLCKCESSIIHICGVPHFHFADALKIILEETDLVNLTEENQRKSY